MKFKSIYSVVIACDVLVLSTIFHVAPIHGLNNHKKAKNNNTTFNFHLEILAFTVVNAIRNFEK